MHSVFQITYITLWMQFLPWSRAHTAFAALEREEEGVKAGGEGEDGVGGYVGGGGCVGCVGCGEEVDELVWVGLVGFVSTYFPKPSN